VSRRHFAEHLEVLQKYTKPVRLTSLRERLHGGSGAHCGVVLTFDDGYADNLYYAKPLLERREIPATVFVASGYIGAEMEFWKDYLERIFLQPGTLPSFLPLIINGKPYQWELGEAAHYSTGDFEQNSGWNVLKTSDPTLRHSLYRSLCQILNTVPEDERNNVLKELLAWAGIEPKPRSTHQTLTADELTKLDDGELMEIGSHTVTHPVLSALSGVTQRDQIQKSKKSLEEILRRSVISFAYPYGGKSHYTEETVANVREAGFEYACSNFDGIVRRGADMWQLPRFLVRDWDGQEFCCRLKQWLRL